MEEKWSEWDEMTWAADEAAKELDPGWTAIQLAQWWAKWYMKTGHKRLGRLIVAMATKKVSL